MFIGPVFTREARTVPRGWRLYVARGSYVAALLMLMYTAWLLVTGSQQVRNLGDMSRFGALLFGFLAPLQMTLAMIFSALVSVGGVSQEKDRRTLVLLLMTRLNNAELVLGKLFSSLLIVLAMLLAAVPVFMLALLLGGVSLSQVLRVFATTLATSLLAGSLGCLLAFWREKTFQALALTLLALVAWVALWEYVHEGGLGTAWAGVSCQSWATAMSPWRAISVAAAPYAQELAGLEMFGHAANVYVVISSLLALLLLAISIAGVRRWNSTHDPGRTAEPEPRESLVTITSAGSSQLALDAEMAAATGLTAPAPTSGLADAAAPATSQHNMTQTARARARAAELASSQDAHAYRPHRRVWDNPVLWREVRTWAYGRKILAIRIAYLALVVAAVTAVYFAPGSTRGGSSPLQTSILVAGVLALSLVLVNALSVTSFCGERDGRTLDLLIASDLSPTEIVWGKLIGVAYNTKEMILLPLGMCALMISLRDTFGSRLISAEELGYLLLGAGVLYFFAATLGIHAGITYSVSRHAILVSLATIIFLLFGVTTCMRMIEAFAGSFELQLQPFLVMVLGGGVGLYAALGVRNNSVAIGIASFSAPFATFYAITSYQLDQPLGVFLTVSITYGFATAAMLVPALTEFDVALGKSTADEE